jgi:glutamyl endopeptidase
MKTSYCNVSKTVLSGAIALSLFSFNAAAETESKGKSLAHIPFEKVPNVSAHFSDEEKFVPLDELPVVEYDEEEEMAPERHSFDLSAVAVTPEGEVFTAEVFPEDLELLENALEQLPGEFTEEQLEEFAESGQMNSESFKGVEVSFGKKPDKAAGPPTGKGPDNEFEGEKETGQGAAPKAEAAARSVLGFDERTRVYATTSFPYRAMGRIASGCTGTLIGPRHVLTAGHCVYNIKTDSWYSNLKFSPGQNGTYRPYGEIGWKRVLSVKGWTDSHSSNYDYAMIVLNQNVGYTTGWLGYGYENGWWTKNVNVNGYPGDKPWGTMWHEYCPMSTQIFNGRRVSHTCDTYKGMSGSALYQYKSGSRIIYAVHTNGGLTENSGTRITSEVYNNLKNWKNLY